MDNPRTLGNEGSGRTKPDRISQGEGPQALFPGPVCGILYFRHIFSLDKNERFGEFLKATCRTMEMDPDKVVFIHGFHAVDDTDTPKSSHMKMDAIITVWEIDQKSDDEQIGKYFISLTSLPLYQNVYFFR